jgi:hypothetical protein
MLEFFLEKLACQLPGQGRVAGRRRAHGAGEGDHGGATRGGGSHGWPQQSSTHATMVGAVELGPTTIAGGATAQGASPTRASGRAGGAVEAVADWMWERRVDDGGLGLL